MSEKKVVVKTQMTGKIISEFNAVAILRLKWFFIPAGLFIIACSLFLIFLPEKPGDTFLGVMLCAAGLFFCVGIFLLPKILEKQEQKNIRPNEITLTFYDDKLNINVSGGEDGEKFITYENPNELLNKAYGFRRDYRNEDWYYREIRSVYASKKLVCIRLVFKDIVIFYKQQIVEGDFCLLGELLTRNMGKRYKNK